MIGRIIIGFLIAAAGFVLVWKTEWFQQNFGSIQWAEAKMGSMGGSRAMYKIIGLVAIITGLLMITNMHKTAFVGLFGWLFGGGGGGPDAGL